MLITKPVLSRCSDKELVRLIAQHKDEAAFEELYQRYYKRAWGLAWRVVGESHWAEDITQEAFFKVWEWAPRYDHQRSQFSSWFLTIVYRRALDYGKKQNRVVFLSQLLASSSSVSGSEPGATNTNELEMGSWGWPVLIRNVNNPATSSSTTNGSNPYQHLLDNLELAQALSQLPPNQRYMIELAFGQGLTHSQVVKLTGLPLGTVKTRIRQGLLKLKELVVVE